MKKLQFFKNGIIAALTTGLYMYSSLTVWNMDFGLAFGAVCLFFVIFLLMYTLDSHVIKRVKEGRK